MLALTYGFLAGAGPFLNGSWDLWAQSILLIASAVSASAWFLFHFVSGRVPSPKGGLFAIGGTLFLLSSISVFLSPIRSLVSAGWFVFLGGLWIIVSAPLVPAASKRWVDRSIIIGAWVQVLLVFYQHFFAADHAVGTLLKENVLAAYLILLVPFAWFRGNVLLSAVLVLALLKTGSLGAFAAVFLFAIGSSWSRGKSRAAAAFSLIFVVALIAKLDDPELVNRLRWWRSAWEMALASPLSGFGPGAFTWVYPVFRVDGGLGTLYAHSYPLQLAAEFGFPFMFLWFVAILRWITAGSLRPSRRIPVILVLLHSCIDISLQIPGLFWLWCYFLSEGCAEEVEWNQLHGRTKALAFVFSAALAAVAIRTIAGAWQSERLLVEATQELGRAPEKEVRRKLERSKSLNPGDARVYRAFASLEAKEFASRGGAFRLLTAAAHQEKAATLNPFRPSTWTELSAIYKALGRPDLARDASRRGASFLRGGR